MNNIVEGIAYAKDGVIFGLIGICIYLFIKKIIKKDLITLSYVIMLYLFFVYCYMVGIITGLFDFSNYHLTGAVSFNLVPFVNESYSLVLLNFLMMFPMGIFIPIVFNNKKFSFKAILIISVLISLAIELIQMFCVGRLADVDDLLANTVGTCAGFLAFVFLKRSIFDSEGWTEKNISALILIVIAVAWSVEINYVSIGDIILLRFGISPYLGMSKQVFTAKGFHITEIPGIVLLGIALKLLIAEKKKNDAVIRIPLILCLISMTYMAMNILAKLL